MALHYAACGLPVLQYDPDTRKPINAVRKNDPKWNATTDPDRIKELYEKRDDAMIATPTGEEAGFMMIDCDIKNGDDGIGIFHAICDEHSYDPEQTLTVDTPSGGRHYFFKHPAGVDIPTKAKYPVEGIDTRGNGGIIMLAGSTTGPGHDYPGQSYRIRNEVEPLPLPDFLVEILRRKKRQKPVVSQSSGTSSPGRSRLEGLKVLEEEADKVSSCPEGSRNDTLNSAAFKCGLFVQDKALKESTARKWLIEAGLECGLPEMKW